MSYYVFSHDYIKPTCVTNNVNYVALRDTSTYRIQCAHVYILLSKGMRMYHIY